MALRSISGTVLLLLAVCAGAQAFGRFGYSENVDVPGFVVERKGFKVRQDQADWFAWEDPSRIWKPVLTTETSQTVMLSGIGRSAEKVRFDLFGAGFSMYFRHGIGFRLSSNQAPFLTWDEGSAGVGVPTPATKWIVVSFRDSQPPVMIAVPEGKEAFTITGRAGDWRLRSSPDFQGWVRIVAPLGVRRMATHNAASLGALKSQILPKAKYFVEPIPKLMGLEVADEPTAVTATWTFDRPFAVTPLPVVLANLGGYPLKLETPIDRIDSSDPSGPISVSRDQILRIRFPVRRIPTGRSLALGQIAPDAIGTVSPIDIPSIAELALLNLSAGRDALTKQSAEDSLATYLGEAKYVQEPFTSQQLPYAVDGSGIDLAAAHALLMQSTITTVRATSEPNSLLTSVVWRRDWRTWQMWVEDVEQRRRAASLAALAAAICPEPARRLDAAMLEAGLSSERGLEVWRARNGFPLAPKAPAAPYEGLRRALFFYSNRQPSDEAFIASLLSEIRVYGDHSVRAETREDATILSWMAETAKLTTLILASAYPLEATSDLNLDQFTAEDALGFTVLRCTPKGPGRCQIRIKAPDWAAPLPKYVEPPRYFAGGTP